MAIQEGSIEVIGKGFIGDKAQQLIDKKDAIEAVGFHIPRSVVLAQDVLDPLEERVLTRSFTPEQQAMINRVAATLGDSPLVVRSSAAGDARGTGIYTSEFTLNQPDRVREAALKVVESYFSESAYAFRRDAHTGEGLGVIIQPLVGTKYEDEYISYYSPTLSGFGYSSTSSENGFIVVSLGIGGGVDTREGVKLTKADLDLHGENLDDYIWEKNAFNSREISLFGDQGIYTAGSKYHVNERQLYGVDLLSFWGGLMSLEERLQHPLYIEWAMTQEMNNYQFWITQIANFDKKLDLQEFDNLGEELFTGIEVVSSGMRKCSVLVFCQDVDEIDLLQKFNHENENYILVTNGSLTSNLHHGRRLEYADFCNASAVLETSSGQRLLLDHLGGVMRSTDKLYATFKPYLRTQQAMIEMEKRNSRIEELKTKGGDLEIIEGNLVVVASERQNRMIIALQK